jgi:hypothetical protein
MVGQQDQVPGIGQIGGEEQPAFPTGNKVGGEDEGQARRSSFPRKLSRAMFSHRLS